MSTVAERAACQVTGTAWEVTVEVPPDEPQVPFVRHAGALLLGAFPGPNPGETGHPRTGDVLVVASEFVTNAVTHGSREPGSRILARYAISGAGSALLFVRNEVGAKPPGFDRLPEDGAGAGPIDLSSLDLDAADDLEQLRECGMGLRCVVPGHADSWRVEVRGRTVLAWAVFGLTGDAPRPHLRVPRG